MIKGVLVLVGIVVFVVFSFLWLCRVIDSSTDDCDDSYR